MPTCYPSRTCYYYAKKYLSISWCIIILYAYKTLCSTNNYDPIFIYNHATDILHTIVSGQVTHVTSAAFWSSSHTTNRTSFTEVSGLRLLNWRSSSNMTCATRRAGKLNTPVPMAGKATDVKFSSWTVWKQFDRSFLRTYKLNNYQNLSNNFF